jgi:hypothetical protein
MLGRKESDVDGGMEHWTIGMIDGSNGTGEKGTQPNKKNKVNLHDFHNIILPDASYVLVHVLTEYWDERNPILMEGRNVGLQA